MDVAKEIIVKIKDDKSSYTEKYLIYEDFALSHDDPKLRSVVEDTLKKWTGEKQCDVYVSIKLMW